MNPIQQQLAKHFSEVINGGNWTCSNVRDQLKDVTWIEASTVVYDLNTIAALTFHVNYFVEVVLRVLQGGPLVGNDKYSYDVAPIHSEADWQRLKERVLSNAEQFSKLLAQQPDHKVFDSLADPKYGSYYRNIHGIIEHTHYHLGQIAVIKKIVRKRSAV